MKPIVSIIIVNYNTLQLTSNCVNSIIEKVHSVDYEIIVVDNASKDNSVVYLKNMYPNIVLIESYCNLGFGRANNIGANYANGTFLFFLNSDTEIVEDPFSIIINFLEKNNKLPIGIIGSFLIDQNGNYVKSGGTFYSASKYLKLALSKYFCIKTKEEVDYSQEHVLVDYVIGADMFIEKKLYDLVQGFDENIFMYFEDVELCKRIHDLGYFAYILKAGKIIHYVKSSSSSQFARVYNTASLMYCLRKEMHQVKFLGFQVLYFFIKLPIIFTNLKQIKNNWEYITSIFDYKKHLNK